MSTFGELKDYVFKSIGISDSVADVIVSKNINESIKLITKLYEPPECIDVIPINYPGGSSYTTIGSSVISIYDAYLSSYGTGTKILSIPIHLLDSYSSSFSKNVYSFSEGKFYLRPIPSLGTTIYSKALVMPNDLVNNTDEMPFSDYDHLVLSIANALTWANFEEQESSRMMQETTAFLTQLSMKPREMRNEPKRDKVSR